MAIDDILFDQDFIFDTIDLVDGICISIDFPINLYVYIPYHGYITQSRLLGGV